MTAKRAVFLLLYSLPAACAREPAGDPAARPGETLVADIERRLAGAPCIGELSRWARHYRYEKRGEEVDKKQVDISLREAGVHGFVAGRFINPPWQRGTFEVDDRPYKLAFATYDVPSRRLEVGFCGSNVEG
jgi:hypothetical protein